MARTGLAEEIHHRAASLPKGLRRGQDAFDEVAAAGTVPAE
jgi:hypothetical protein